MRPLLLLCCTASTLTACGPGGLRGAWSGACDFNDGDYGEVVYLDLSINRDLGRRLSGTATVTVPSDGVYEVELWGEHTLDAVIMELTVQSETGQLDLSFEGQRDADELEGPCELWVPGATSPIIGRGELER